MIGHYYKFFFSHFFQMFMGLHSWKYTVNNMTFEAPLPKWATDSTYLDQIYETRKNFNFQNPHMTEMEIKT